MEKIKNICKWVGYDGLLHILCVFAILMVFIPIIGLWWSIGLATIASAFKEAFDVFVQKDNNKEQVIHDVICDGVGLLIALATMIMWKM